MWHFLPNQVCFAAKKPITFEWRHIANALSPCGLTWSVGMLLIFENVRMTDLGYKTGYRTLKSVNMCSNLLIHQADN